MNKCQHLTGWVVYESGKYRIEKCSWKCGRYRIMVNEHSNFYREIKIFRSLEGAIAFVEKLLLDSGGKKM